MTRVITQVVLGLMLTFGFVTLLIKATFFFRFGLYKKGALYLLMSGVAGFIAVLSFHFAWGEAFGPR